MIRGSRPEALTACYYLGPVIDSAVSWILMVQRCVRSAVLSAAFFLSSSICVSSTAILRPFVVSSIPSNRTSALARLLRLAFPSITGPLDYRDVSACVRDHETDPIDRRTRYSCASSRETLSVVLCECFTASRHHVRRPLSKVHYLSRWGELHFCLRTPRLWPK